MEASPRAPRSRLAAAGVAVACAVARLPHLGRKELWLDEAVAVHIARLDLGGIVAASRRDTTPPLHYLVLGAAERLLGIWEWAVRLPSVLAGAALGAALFLLARRRVGAAGAWTTAALFLLSDIHLAFSREARPYELTALLCVAAYGVLLEATERGTWRWWALLGVLDGALVFTHYVAVLAIAAQGVWLLAAAPRRVVFRFVAVQLPVAAALTAWVAPIVAAGEHKKMGWLAPPGPEQVSWLLGWFSGGHARLAGFAVLLLGTVGALEAARRRGDRTLLRPAGLFASWALVPLVLSFTASHLGASSFHPRYLLYASCGLLLLWGTAVQALPSRRWRAVGILLALLATVPGVGRSLRGDDWGWRGAAEFLRERKPPRIALLPYFELWTLAYHYDRAAFSDASRTGERLAAAGVRVLADERGVAQLDLDGIDDLYLVRAPSALRSAAVEEALAARGFVERERHAFGKTVVVRLVRRPAPPG